MKSLSEILKKLKENYPTLGKRVEESKAIDLWSQTVGPQISKHTMPLRVKDQVLFVKVDHPVWRAELHYQRTQILASLNAQLNFPLKGIEFTTSLFVGPTPPQPREPA